MVETPEKIGKKMTNSEIITECKAIADRLNELTGSPMSHAIGHYYVDSYNSRYILLKSTSSLHGFGGSNPLRDIQINARLPPGLMKPMVLRALMRLYLRNRAILFRKFSGNNERRNT